MLPSDPRRRPGDIFISNWPSGAIAMDFAVTSPMQQSVLASAAETQLAAASEYEQRKYNDRDTAAKCQRFGLKLVPMVVESFGGWGQQAQETFKGIASELAAQQGGSVGKTSDQMYQGFSIILMRANARALLTRVAGAGLEALGPASAA